MCLMYFDLIYPHTTLQLPLGSTSLSPSGLHVLFLNLTSFRTYKLVMLNMFILLYNGFLELFSFDKLKFCTH